ncbi:MAG: hypothetical protein KGJ13_02080 [Patescibacteria group bacterium]|nr:hypothetical protein [Patescibacteria group bacterium]
MEESFWEKVQKYLAARKDVKDVVDNYERNNPMPEEKTCACMVPVKDLKWYSNHGWKFCPMCGKPLKEKEWEPEVGKTYWYIWNTGKVASLCTSFIHDSALKGLHAAGALFDTREAAEKHLSMVKCVDSRRELPKKGEWVYIAAYGTIVRMPITADNETSYASYILWRLGFAQPDTPEGRALLEKNIREHKEWFE